MNTKHLAIILFCLLPVAAAAESALGSHCLAVWANGGVAEYIGSTPQISKTLGGGGALGIGYEWRGRSILVQAGLGARYISAGFKADNAIYTLPNQYDSEGDLMDYQYLESKRRDSYNQLAVQIPVMVGVHANHFYFLVGPKVGLNILNQAKASGVYSAQGVYEMLIDPLAHMDNHMFFTDRELTSEQKYGMKINVAGSLELGGEFTLREGSNGDTYMRIGAFADINILDDRATSNNPMLKTPAVFNDKDMLSEVKLTDYLHSSAATNQVRQLFAGIKLTFVFTSGVKYGCVMCDGGYPSARDRRRGSRLMVR